MLARIGQAPLNCPGDPGCPGNLMPIDTSNLPLIGPYLVGSQGASPLVTAQLAVGASALNPALQTATVPGASWGGVPGGAATVAIGGALLLLIVALPGRRR